MTIFDRVINKFWRLVKIPASTIRLNKNIFYIQRFLLNDFYKKNYKSEAWLDYILNSLHQKLGVNVFIDVGVNIGQTLLKIKNINTDVKYIGFEPNPNCITLVNNIISKNNLKHSTIIPCGLSNKYQLLKLKLSSKNDLLDSSATVIEGFREQNSYTHHFVPVLALDEIIDSLELNRVDVIKIDIEGAELEAIMGMIKTLKRFTPIIIMEVLPSYDITNEFRIIRQTKLVDLLKQVSYSIFQVKNKDKIIYLEKVDKFPIHKNVDDSDYLLVPQRINVNDIFSVK